MCPKGKVLYRIDPRTYQANYESAKARLAESEAQFANAERTLNRLKPLAGRAGGGPAGRRQRPGRV